MRRLAIASLLALALTGCGGDTKSDEASKGTEDPAGVPFGDAIREARSVEAGDLPAARGRTLQQIAGRLPAIQLGPATSIYTPGTNRLAFGMLDQTNTFVYGKTGIYLARTPDGRALGPFAAPADPLLVEAPFRSRGAAHPSGEIAAIYNASVDLPRTGKWYVLAVTRSQGKLFGAASTIEVTGNDPVPAVGEQPPRVQTETLASAGGDIESIDTRVPPSDMHGTDFRDVVGKRPVALLFATPRLCQTRVCGPVVDIAAQMQTQYGDQMEFIHQEVYVDNDVSKGYRAPLEGFGLRTEPWLFTIDADGRVAARLEGSFGVDEFRDAVEAALG
ncbi:MAG: hypothetical protein H0U25_04930 [Thermoleophilaceae bacterium]|nr:hypothetical protein [Thermoleophilaceae bacterium]